jgi:hypothetical protein
MEHAVKWTRIGILIGGGVFVAALVGSAIVVPALRPLHFFQALIYVAVVSLGRRGNSWALGAGTVVAASWNALQLLVTHNMQTGAALWWRFFATGTVQRLDTMMVFVAGVGHFVLLAACLSAQVAARPGPREWLRFAGGGVLVVGYMAAIIALLLPR